MIAGARRRWAAPLYLLAGAAVNVAVAWGGNLWLQPQGQGTPADKPRWPCEIPSEWPTAADHAVSWRRAVVSRRYGLGFRGHDYFLESLDCGWPLHALHRCIAIRSTPAGIRRVPHQHGGIEIPPWFPSAAPPESSDLPCVILPVGFAANTLLYSGLLWGAGVTLARARRRRRQRRNLCPRCAYDLRGNPTPMCPECGRGATLA